MSAYKRTCTHTYIIQIHTTHTHKTRKKDKDEISFFFPSEIFSAHSLQEQFKLLLLTKFPRNGGKNGMETMVRKDGASSDAIQFVLNETPRAVSSE